MDILEKNFIIYNNRSEKLVEKFLPILNVKLLENIEFLISYIISSYDDVYNTTILIDDNYLNLNYNDILFTKEELENILISLKNNKIEKETLEYDYLTKRNIPLKYINNLFVLSSNLDIRTLEIIGATLHPLLINIFDNQINNGVIFPIYENKKITNIAIRRMENGPLKYSLAIPDITVIGLDKVNNGDNIWICEGILDSYALTDNKLKVVTVSSSGWSSIQLCLLVEKKPKSVNIFADYDYTGLKNASIIKKVLMSYNIETKIWVSKYCKDPCEHFYERKLTFKDIERIEVSNLLLSNILSNDNKDYYHYLKYKKVL